MLVNIVVSGIKLGSAELIIATLEMPDTVTLSQATAIANAHPNVVSALSRVIFISVGLTTAAGRTALRYVTSVLP